MRRLCSRSGRVRAHPRANAVSELRFVEGETESSATPYRGTRRVAELSMGSGAGFMEDEVEKEERRVVQKHGSHVRLVGTVTASSVMRDGMVGYNAGEKGTEETETSPGVGLQGCGVVVA